MNLLSLTLNPSAGVIIPFMIFGGTVLGENVACFQMDKWVPFTVGSLVPKNISEHDFNNDYINLEL